MSLRMTKNWKMKRPLRVIQKMAMSRMMILKMIPKMSQMKRMRLLMILKPKFA